MPNKKDNLGDRMKENYENRTRYLLPRRTHTIIRIDGKAFHTFTKGCQRPFDRIILNSMNSTMLTLCQELQGVKLAYVQSDEISLVLTDFEDIQTQAWFDGNLQKICSVSASIATGAFNKYWNSSDMDGTAYFDARVFTIPDPIEVHNYFVWRQKDCIRNSISMVAQSLYSHKQLQGKNCNEMQEMIFQKDINWNDYPSYLKRGRVAEKTLSGWEIPLDTPEFTKQPNYITDKIIKKEDEE